MMEPISARGFGGTLRRLLTLCAVLAVVQIVPGTIIAAQEQAVTPPTPMPPMMMADALASAQEGYDPKSSNHLSTFDTLDFDVYSNQKWDRLKESHADSIVVHYPDGHITRGLKAHIEELKPTFAFAPDTHVISHPVKIGFGEWTAVIGEGVGTFTKPMQIGPDRVIKPTGKKFDYQMVTIGHWTKAGVMDEEWLFWDNATFAKQVGIM